MESIRPGRYRHFKGKEYRLLYTARHSETQELMVVYQALYGEQGFWVRPASMWSESVERDGYSGPRFTYLGEDSLALEPLSPEARPLLEVLLQSYLCELAPYAPGLAPDRSGRYPYPYLDAYFTEPDRTALLLRADGRTAGFALVNAYSALGEPIDHAVAEFYVLPAFRGQGCGGQAVRQLFAARPGRWEIQYHPANRSAQALWTRSAAPYAPTLRAHGGMHILSFTV